MDENKLAIAVVGLGCVMPDAQDPASFWQNILAARYSIGDVPPDRWRPDLYYNPDPSVPDKTYSKIGGWVRDYAFDARKLGLAIPPRVLNDMDIGQQWAISASKQALDDYGYPNRVLDPERVAVIFGNAMAGEKHYHSSLRIYLPEYVDVLNQIPDFQSLPENVRQKLVEGLTAGIRARIPGITEDTMPGELGNILAGRVANLFNFRGPNYITDAACASSLAAFDNAIGGLINHHFDAALTGGIDRNMGVEGFVKFCKIGALSPDGSRPYSDGANGFVMGEGGAVFLLKRLVDAEKDGDKIYAVIRGVGGSSDGKGKGITAPNPIGQQRAIERGWQNAGLDPATAGLIEGHGTSTKVGDVVEVQSLNAIFGSANLKTGSVALGSVKSNVGHLKSAAGAAAVLKTSLALYNRTLPPSANFERPNPNIEFEKTPFYVNTAPKPWEVGPNQVRRAGVSSFGFGGTNFHMVLEEYRPGVLSGEKKIFLSAEPTGAKAALPQPPRGLVFLGAATPEQLKQKLDALRNQLAQGQLPPRQLPPAEEIRCAERLAIDYTDAADLEKKLEKAANAILNPNLRQAATAQGIFLGSGTPGKVAFLFPGQGSQYVNMLAELRAISPVVAETFREADEIMTPILGRPLTEYIFVSGDEASLAKAEADLKNTAITQPAMLTANVAVMRLLATYGFAPDMVIGHSLGEYGALVAAGVFKFGDALRIVSARGREMTRIQSSDNGCMAAVSAPLAQVEEILKTVPGYVVLANINSPVQSVIGGDTAAVEAAIEAFKAAGIQAVKIAVSHAFHTRIVAPASEPLGKLMEGMEIGAPSVPVIANVTGKAYPNTKVEVIDLLKRQIASPVQFVSSVKELYAQGAPGDPGGGDEPPAQRRVEQHQRSAVQPAGSGGRAGRIR